MNQDTFSRRTLLVGAAALVAASPLRALAGAVSPTTIRLRRPQIGQGTQSLSGEGLPLSQGG